MNRSFWLGLLINVAALGAISVLVATAVLPENWIISPIYILACSFAYRPFLRLDPPASIVILVATFVLFPFLNWAIISLVLSMLTI